MLIGLTFPEMWSLIGLKKVLNGFSKKRGHRVKPGPSKCHYGIPLPQCVSIDIHMFPPVPLIEVHKV